MFRNENFVKLEFCLFIGGNIVTNYNSFLLVSEILALIITTKRSFSSTIMIN